MIHKQAKARINNNEYTKKVKGFWDCIPKKLSENLTL